MLWKRNWRDKTPDQWLHLTRKSLDADDGLTKVIHDLENQLETAKNSQRLADEKIHELEQELKNLKNLEEVR